MKKRSHKKLRIHKETLRRLSDQSLSGARGGADSDYCQSAPCETYDNICYLLTLAPNCALPPWD